MKPSKYISPLILIVITTLVSACGGSGGSSGGSDDPETPDNPVAKTDCVLGTSTIGDCKI